MASFKSGGRNPASPGLRWKFSQVFGERQPGEQVHEVDVISAVGFEKNGDYLAVGDHGGRIILFERADGKVTYSGSERSVPSANAAHPRYTYMTEFQSHEPEFDYLKNLEIEEKVNKLRWCATLKNSLFILTTNSRTIKLWKIQDRKVKKIKNMGPNPMVCSENALLSEKSFSAGRDGQLISSNYRLEWINKKPNCKPAESCEDRVLIPNNDEATSSCRRVYAHAHEYNVNSISINSDGETFLSADDFRVNLWNFEISNQCFNIIDMKPPNMEDLIEVITAAEFHPTYCNILAYGSSRGFIRLVDMRHAALCDQSARILQGRAAHAPRTIFAETISSITDIKFSTDGVHILSRDYMNLKLWDLRMESAPVATFKVHEYLRPKLAELYNNDSVFDKFECCMSEDGLYFASGSYSNIFKVFSCNAGDEDGVTLEASKNPNRKNFCQTTTQWMRLPARLVHGYNRQGKGNSNSKTTCGIPCDATSKLTHLAWHPTTNLIACAAANSLYMYYA